MSRGKWIEAVNRIKPSPLNVPDIDIQAQRPFFLFKKINKSKTKQINKQIKK